MHHTLVTGMSATGRSTTVTLLLARGIAAVDLDGERWSHEVPDGSPFADHPGATDSRWRDTVVELLLAHVAGPGCARP